MHASDGSVLLVRARRLVAGSALLCLALTGCGGGDDPSPAPSSSTTVAATAADPSKSEQGGSVADDLDGAEGVKRDVELAACSDAAPLAATGRVTNSSETELDIVVSVSWTGEGSRVLARGEAIVADVAAGDTVGWEITSDETPDGPLTCVVSARSGQLSG